MNLTIIHKSFNAGTNLGTNDQSHSKSVAGLR